MKTASRVRGPGSGAVQAEVCFPDGSRNVRGPRGLQESSRERDCPHRDPPLGRGRISEGERQARDLEQAKAGVMKPLFLLRGLSVKSSTEAWRHNLMPPFPFLIRTENNTCFDGGLYEHDHGLTYVDTCKNKESHTKKFVTTNDTTPSPPSARALLKAFKELGCCFFFLFVCFLSMSPCLARKQTFLCSKLAHFCTLASRCIRHRGCVQ